MRSSQSMGVTTEKMPLVFEVIRELRAGFERMTQLDAE